MVNGSPAAAALIGRAVVDVSGHRLGRVVAVIHRAHSTDVLVEGRRWLHHHSHRFALNDMEPLPDGRLLVHPDRPATLWGTGQEGGTRRMAGIEGQ
jgi:uncharacterized protein YrrD